MNTLSNKFFRAALVFFGVGIGLGVFMSVSQDFTIRPVHVHVNLLGWVCFFLYGAFYRFFPEAAQTKLAASHFWSAVVGMPPMMIGLGLVLYGYEMPGVPLLLAGELLSVVSVALFMVVGFRATAGAATTARHPAQPVATRE